jgi:DNA polymerase III subunit beta
MEFEVDRNKLLATAETAAALTDHRGVSPITSEVHIRATDALDMTATDLSIMVRQKCDATIKKKGNVSVGGKRLIESVRALPEGVVKVSEKDSKLVLQCGGRKLTLCCAPEPTTLDVPVVEGERVELRCEQILAGYRAVSHAMKTGSKEALSTCGICVDIVDGNMVTRAIDGHRVAVHRQPFTGTAFAIFLPSAMNDSGHGFVQRLAKGCEDHESVTITSSKTRILAEFNDGWLTGVLPGGPFPSHEQIGSLFAAKQTSSFTVDRTAFAESVKAMQMVGRDSSGGTCLEMSGEGGSQLTLETSDVNAGRDAVDKLDADVTGAPFRTGVEARYLIDMLKSLNGDKVTFKISADLNPLVVSEEDRDFVIMPRRV